MKRPDHTPADARGSRGVEDTSFAQRFPALLMYLQDTKWDDGSAREPSTITLFIEHGAFKAALNDRDGKRSLYVTGSTVESVLDVLEANAREDRGEWRYWSQRKGTRK